MPNIYTLLLVIYVRSMHYEKNRLVHLPAFTCSIMEKLILNLNKFGPKSSPPRRQYNQKSMYRYPVHTTLCFLIRVVEGNFQVSS